MEGLSVDSVAKGGICQVLSVEFSTSVEISTMYHPNFMISMRELGLGMKRII
jgi:hypothetical protein